jgi:hypothetical protein
LRSMSFLKHLLKKKHLENIFLTKNVGTSILCEVFNCLLNIFIFGK